MSIIARRLISAREAANLTQEELASLLGISQEAYGGYERKRTTPGIDRLMDISEKLGKPITFFLGIDNDLSDAETDLLHIYRRIPAHMQETALDLLRVLIQVPTPAEVSADPPPPTEITEAIGNLDPQQQEQVLDFVDFLTEPRIQQILHQKQRRRDIQRSIDIIDLYLAVCEATPEERQRLITDLLYQLQGG